MIYFVYKITNLINLKVYIGVHSTNNIEDGYMGSGLRIVRSIEKYGISNFRKEILSFHDTMEDALLEEKRLVTPDFVASEATYNLKEGGSGGKLSLESRLKQSAAATASWEKAEVRAARRAASLLTRQSPSFRSKLASSVKKSYTPELIARKSAIMLCKAQDPQYREALSKGVAKSYEGEAGELLRKKRAESTLKRWEDPEARREMSERFSKPQRQVTCPFCGKIGGVSNMKRHHFDNCKEKNQ